GRPRSPLRRREAYRQGGIRERACPWSERQWLRARASRSGSFSLLFTVPPRARGRCLRCAPVALDQVGPPWPSFFDRWFASPRSDLRMIPRPQHFGDRAPCPCHWSGIVRIFQETFIEALLLSAGGRAHYPGQEPYASVEDDHRPQ